MKRILILLLIPVLLVNPLYALKGWHEERGSNSVEFIPINLKNDKTFLIRLYVPVNLEGRDLKEWFLGSAKNIKLNWVILCSHGL